MIVYEGTHLIAILKGPDGQEYVVKLNYALVQEMRQLFGLESEVGLIQKLLESPNGEVGSEKTSFQANLLGRLVK